MQRNTMYREQESESASSSCRHGIRQSCAEASFARCNTSRMRAGSCTVGGRKMSDKPVEQQSPAQQRAHEDCRASACPSKTRRCAPATFRKSTWASLPSRRARNRCAASSAPNPAASEVPGGVKIKDVCIDLICAGDYLAAAAKMREDNALPAITGRVCPQEDQCEVRLRSRQEGRARRHRHTSSASSPTGSASSGSLDCPRSRPPPAKKSAIVGSGPAGLACAGDLIQKGHQVHVFEALHELGGVLVYGIPEFRLPKDIVTHEDRRCCAARAWSSRPTWSSARP